MNADRKLGRAADLHESFPIALHFVIVGDPRQRVLQNPSGILIRRFNNSVVHPRSLPSCADDPCSTQVSQVPANLWLVCLEDLDKEANAYFVTAHEIQKAQPSTICQGAEKSLFGESSRFAHDRSILARPWIYGLTYIDIGLILAAHIRVRIY